MSDEEMSNVHEVVWSQKTKEPKIVLQMAEEIFPILKEGVVSDVCMK
jgi:nitrate reductase NapE component